MPDQKKRAQFFIQYTILFVIAPLSIQLSTHAQPLLSGSRNAVLSHSSVASSEALWPEANPASIASNTEPHVSVFVSEAYGLRELQSSAVNIIVPTNGITLGAMIHSFGYKLYRELKLVTSLAHRVRFGSSRFVFMGASLVLNRIGISTIGYRTELALSVGMLMEIWPALFVGVNAAHWLKPESSSLLEEEFRIGTGYLLTEEIRLLVAVHKSIAYPPSLTIGIEQQLNKVLTFRTRIGTRPTTAALGVDIHLGIFSAGLVAEKHVILNWTPALSIDLCL